MKDAKVTNWLAKRGKFDHLVGGGIQTWGARIMMDQPGTDGNGPRTCHNGQAWTVTYGQIIFTLTPFFAYMLDVASCKPRRPPILEETPNDFSALLHCLFLSWCLLVFSHFFLTYSCNSQKGGQFQSFNYNEISIF